MLLGSTGVPSLACSHLLVHDRFQLGKFYVVSAGVSEMENLSRF